MSVISQHAAGIGSVGWILAALALILKTNWTSGPDSYRRRLTFAHELFLLTFVSVTFVAALTIKFPNLEVVNNTLPDIVSNGQSMNTQVERLSDALMYHSRTTMSQFEELCTQNSDSFTLPEIIGSELGLTENLVEFEVKFGLSNSIPTLDVSCWPDRKMFQCRCNS